MQVSQSHWSLERGFTGGGDPPESRADLVFLFGSPRAMQSPGWNDELGRRHPGALWFGCSTAGEILGTQVFDDSLVATAVRFDSTRVRGARESIEHASDSHAVGRKLGRALPAEGLQHVLVLSDGMQVNGSALAAGLTAELPEGVLVTGGLSADGARFQSTMVLFDGPAAPGGVAVVGLYGRKLRVGCGSLGGWDPFGPERMVTRAEGNILFELDGRSALALYKEYLGEHARELPASALLFPLAVRDREDATPVVRTILAVDEQAQSMTFAGDVPQGAMARLMKANFNRLLDGASGAARTCHDALQGSTAELALLISCVGRKLVLKQRIEEELEGVRDVLGPTPALAGFYSYGEISPFTPGGRCELHNQTMTITTLTER